MDLMFSRSQLTLWCGCCLHRDYFLKFTSEKTKENQDWKSRILNFTEYFHNSTWSSHCGLLCSGKLLSVIFFFSVQSAVTPLFPCCRLSYQRNDDDDEEAARERRRRARQERLRQKEEGDLSGDVSEKSEVNAQNR